MYEKKCEVSLQEAFMKYLQLISIVIAASFLNCSNVSDTCIDESKNDPTASCAEYYAPVCGCDGVTYSNDCFAEINGVQSYSPGKCE